MLYYSSHMNGKLLFVFLILFLSALSFKWRFSRRVVCAIYVLFALSYIGFLSVLCVDILPYQLPSQPTRDLVPGKKVLILVPHEDDELNVAGGILSSLVEKKEVYVAFSTNGDYSSNQEQTLVTKTRRYREAVEAMATYGIPEDHVIFLGYGDQWMPAKNPTTGELVTHLYSAPEDMRMSSFARMTETYGHPSHPCFHEHQPYTKGAFMQDLKDLLAFVHADTIICVDYDAHPDHRALSLSFDKVMGELLRQNPDYRPLVLKSFAYSVAWFAPKIFYHLNIPATPAPYASGLMDEVNCYRWSSRVRFPVDADSVSRSVYQNHVYRALSCHQSQVRRLGAAHQASKMIKGDKVFWWRPTDNILLTAEVYSGVGNAEALHDFMLVDSAHIDWTAPKPFQHGWFVEQGKNNECVFRFRQAERVREIRLYDHPSPDNQIQELSLVLSNGKEIIVRDLPATGEPLSVRTETDDLLDGFTLRVKRFCGDNAGLAEVEAYSEYPVFPSLVVKMMDADGNFLYDYKTTEGGCFDVALYSTRPLEVGSVELCLYDASSESIRLTSRGNNAYQLLVPRGESCILKVVDKTTRQVLDAARIHNPGRFLRWTQVWQNCAEQHLAWLYKQKQRVLLFLP